SKILALFRALDSLLIVCTLWFILRMLQIEWDNSYTSFAIGAVIIFGFFAEGNEVYYLWRGYSMTSLASRLLFAWIGTALIVGAAVITSLHFNKVDLQAIMLWLAITPEAMVGLHWGRRIVLTKLRSNPSEPRRVAIVGANELGLRMINSIADMPWLGYRIVGFYDDRVKSESSDERRLDLDEKNLSVNGDLDQLYKDAHAGKIDIVFVTLPMRAEFRIHAVINRLADTTVTPYVIPDVFNFDLLHSRLTCIQGIPALSIYDSPLVDNSVAKRLEDLIIGFGMLLALALPMLIVAIGVKLTSPGPVFFKQTRYGMRGEHIKVWKFRSMTVCEDGDTVTQAKKGDMRVTPFGNFLRRTSLDELPQLLNVLAGSMSLVGPRPHALAVNEQYRKLIPGYMVRHKVKPGITGWAQVNGCRGGNDLDSMRRRTEFDLAYLRSWSLWLDLLIVFKTVKVLVVGDERAF
ncbi:MAG: undecaprenyl-phosphate glucose phosphotransferase, partial [Moraxellaceae bacterium]